MPQDLKQLQRDMAQGTRNARAIGGELVDSDLRFLQNDMSDGFAEAQYRAQQKRRQEYENAVAKAKDATKRIKDYTKEGQVDPSVRAYQKSYYRGDKGMKPLDPNNSNPGDQQLRDPLS